MIKIGSQALLLVFALFFSILAPAADETEVFATVDRNEMAVGDTFTYSVSVKSTSSVNTSEPKLAPLNGLDLINKWTGTESRSTFANGQFQTEMTRTFNYLLATQQPGPIKIGSAQVKVDGTVHHTKAISIRVLPRGQAPSQPQRPQQQQAQDSFDRMDDVFSQLLQRQRQMNRGFRTQPVNPDEAFFIQVEVDKTKVYAGEQVTASWYLYTRGQIREIDTLKYPSLNGFWKEEIEMAKRLDFKQEVINGIAYKKALLASFALFPINAGTATIDPYKAKCTVIVPSDFGFGRPYQFTKASKPVKIQVMPIPAEGRPADYSGAVGRFKMTASVTNEEVKENQPVTLKVRFEGRGNAKLIDLPPLDLPPSLEYYDMTKNSQFFRDGQSYKEFEVLLVPRKAGEVVIPAISVSAFDPGKGEYYQQASDPISLQVQPGDGESAISSSPLAQSKESKEEQKPQLPQLALEWSSTNGSGFIPRPVSWGLLYLLVFGLLGWRARVELGWGQKKKDLHKVFQQRIKNIYEKADREEWRQVGVELTNLVYHVLGELSGEGGANLELEKLFRKAPPSLRREIEAPLSQQMRLVEVLSFAPEAVVGPLKTKKEMRKLVSSVEKLLNRAIKMENRKSDEVTEAGAHEA